MAVNTTIDGYEISSDGIASSLSAIQIRANEILASIGTSATNIYNYVRSNNKYKYIEETKTLAEIESIGWSYFADYAMDNRFVVCYYFAAKTDVIFQQAAMKHVSFTVREEVRATTTGIRLRPTASGQIMIPATAMPMLRTITSYPSITHGHSMSIRNTTNITNNLKPKGDNYEI